METKKLKVKILKTKKNKTQLFVCPPLPQPQTHLPSNEISVSSFHYIQRAGNSLNKINRLESMLKVTFLFLFYSTNSV